MPTGDPEVWLKAFAVVGSVVSLGLGVFLYVWRADRDRIADLERTTARKDDVDKDFDQANRYIADVERRSAAAVESLERNLTSRMDIMLQLLRRGGGS